MRALDTAVAQPASPLHLELGDEVVVRDGLRKDACDLFYQMWIERSALATGLAETTPGPLAQAKRSRGRVARPR